MNNTDPMTLEGWLRRLEWALHPLSASHRGEIARELRTHIEERISRGSSEADVLASFGLPEDHARGFLQDFELSQALGTRTLPRMMAVAGHRLHRSVAAAGAVFAVLLLAVFAAGVVVTAVMHFVDPAHWGLWVSQHMFLIGHVDDPREAREILGFGIYPFAVVSVAACWTLGRLFLLAALKTMVRRRSGGST